MGNELQEIVLSTAMEFIQKKIAPIAGYIDENEEFPLETVKEMGRNGLLGIPYPEKYDGAGLDYSVYTNVIREIAKVSAAVAMTVVSHTSLACNPIFMFGSSKLKENYLKQLIIGDKIGAFGLTEPNSGSDIASMETTAVETDEFYILNGSKIFITNANVADVFIVAAKTSPQKNGMGISIFLLERGMEGFSTSGKSERKLGVRGSDTGELLLDHVRVPKENLIGRKNLGLEILHNTLVCARLGMAAIAVGIAQGAQDCCLKYVKQRKQFNQLIYHFQSIKIILADMEVNINAANLLLEKAVLMKEQGKSITKESSEAKLFASEMATKVTKDAIQLLGAYGYSRDFPLERFFRDAKITEIGDGTSEIHRLIIADEIIKKKEQMQT